MGLFESTEGSYSDSGSGLASLADEQQHPALAKFLFTFPFHRAWARGHISDYFLLTKPVKEGPLCLK